MTKEVIWPLMELMESTSPSSYNTVLELDKKIRDLSATINIYEDEQFNASAATVEWTCILGANVRQAGEYLYFHPWSASMRSILVARALSALFVSETNTCASPFFFIVI